MEYQVTWTATYNTRVKLKPGQTLEEAIENINIPEDAQSSYQCGTFEPVEAEDETGKRIKQSQWDKVVGDVTKIRPKVVESVEFFLKDREDSPGDDKPSYEGLADELSDLVDEGEQHAVYERLCEHFRVHDVSLAGVDRIIERIYE